EDRFLALSARSQGRSQRAAQGRNGRFAKTSGNDRSLREAAGQCRLRADIANRRWTSRRPAFQWSPGNWQDFAQSGLPTFPTRNTRTQSGNWPRAEAFSRETIEQSLPTAPAPLQPPQARASPQSLRARAR